MFELLENNVHRGRTLSYENYNEVIFSRLISWAAYVTRMGRQGAQTEFWWLNPFENCRLESREGRKADNIKMYRKGT